MEATVEIFFAAALQVSYCLDPRGLRTTQPIGGTQIIQRAPDLA
jgi:hypothetical protein